MKPTKTTSAGRLLRAILAVLGLVALLLPAALGAELAGLIAGNVPGNDPRWRGP
ncbi:MAG TPA: hypothetical protein VFH53_01645 [Phycisphaerae bacterium]|nr:hypothetical protein [Phycisphaerae bacterium]